MKNAVLGDAADFINGFAFKPSHWNGSGRQIIRIQNLTDASKPFNRTIFEPGDRYIVRTGDLLVSWSATLGVFEWTGEEALVNQHIFKVIPKNGMHKRYLRYAIDKALFDMEKHLHGATMKHVNRKEFLETPIYLPSGNEQKRIAAILDKADAIRRKRAEALFLADEFLKSAFLDMFGDPVTNLKGWPRKSLGKLLSFMTSGSRGWAKYYSDKGKLFLRIQNVGYNRLLMDDMAFVLPPDSAEARRTLVQPGDVVLSITADLGRTAVIPKTMAAAHINQHLALLRPKDIHPLYLSAFLSSSGGQTQINALNRNGVKAGLNFSDVRSLKILLPPTLLQKRFVGIYDKHTRMVEHQNRAIDNVDALFDSLLQRAFRGDL